MSASAREAARRAEAERYLRTSGAKLRFWLFCALVFPVANVLAGFGTVVVLRGDEGPPNDLGVIPVVAAAVIEGVLLRRLVRVFAIRREAAWVICGMAVVVAMSMLLLWAVVIVGLLTQTDSS